VRTFLSYIEIIRKYTRVNGTSLFRQGSQRNSMQQISSRQPDILSASQSVRKAFIDLLISETYFIVVPNS
jgi:hypothetical protein